MKPLKLRIQAFANYAGEQIIDFTELNGRNMFLITGKTGAGKTTIFDAISYALYGESSGGFRSVDSLRSDYADGAVETVVELDFELRGEVYKVIRKPAQKLNKKRGEGLTLVGAEANLYLPGTEKPITRISTVDETIVDILGVSSEQFKQIVMLPQGEFIKFLKASSIDRETIFRKIFGTEQFNRVQIKLSERAKKLGSELKVELSNRNVFVKKIKAEENSILESKINAEEIDIDAVLELTKEFIDLDLERAKEFEKENSTNKIKIKSLEDRERTLNNNMTIIKSYEDNKRAYEEKSLLSNTVDEWRVKLEKGRKALSVKAVEESYSAAKVRFVESENLLKKSELEKEVLYKKLEISKGELEKEKAREDEKQKYLVEVDLLSKQEIKVTDYDTKKKSLEKIEGEFAQLDAQIKRLEKSQESEEKSKRECEKYISEGTEVVLKMKDIVQQGKEKKEQIEKAKVLSNNFENIRYQKMDFDEKRKRFTMIESEYKKAKELYEVSEDLFRKAQAGILAENLVDGEMCPVCGSKEHPLKAVKPSEVPSQAELKVMKSKYEDEDLKREKALSELAALKTKIESDYKNIIEVPATELLDILGEDFLSLEESEKRERATFIGIKLNGERDELLKEYSALKKRTELYDQKKELLATTNEALEGIKVSLNNFKPMFEEKNKALLTISEQVKGIECEIPEELRSLERIQLRKAQLDSTIQSIIKACDLAEKLHADLAQKYSAAIKAIELNKDALSKVNIEVKELKVKFEESITKEGFTGETYKEFANISNLEMIETKIKNYDKELSELKGAFGNATKEFEKLEIQSVEEINISLAKVQLEMNDVNSEEKVLQEKINVCTNRANHNKESIEDIIKATEKIKDRENEYKDVEHLAKIARGEGGNEKKITFESYILTSYFDEIIIVANQRLGKMTNGRFELRRAEETKGKGRKGLELNVLDNNTGFARGINSLSGGESFKAALSIALGLADVIQSYAGGISIETMFIDEGFGTLDPDSLDTAIQCLLDLQSGGRLVGVISHVQELKERIEARLEVTLKDDNRGSKAQFIIQ
ncbi:MAG: AAA family ATPase [Sarcina sp.]